MQLSNRSAIEWYGVVILADGPHGSQPPRLARMERPEPGSLQARFRRQEIAPQDRGDPGTTDAPLARTGRPTAAIDGRSHRRLPWSCKRDSKCAPVALICINGCRCQYAIVRAVAPGCAWVNGRRICR